MRNRQATDFTESFHDLAELCWPVHEEVLKKLGPTTILCLGRQTGTYVARKLKADKYLGHYTETNIRGWKSHAKMSASGLKVMNLTHPSRANWQNPNSDPSDFVSKIINT